MIKTKTVQMIDVGDWDSLVIDTYSRPYSYQQQNGCQSRGIFEITIPSFDEDFDRDSIPEEINGKKMGVSFKAWLERDPKEWNGEEISKNSIDMFWERNFYPHIQMIANDLHYKGLIPEGKYTINIDW